MSRKIDRETILIVEDALATREILQRNLASKKYRAFTAGTAEEAIRVLKDVSIDLVITDLKMPGVGGMELTRYIRENFKDTEVMMITGYASVDGAVEAIKIGAEEYLSKPFTNDELLEAVKRVLNKLHRRRASEAEPKISLKLPIPLLGESEPMQQIYRSISKAAETLATVLITGESGTGKELVARAIHYGSKRASAPFIPVNCGGIPENLLESELFGYVKGAFTGATESRAGFFQTADGGSIFLDEISETSLAMQVKLLRVLQDKETCMVGASRPAKVNVRIVAATNKNLLTLIEKKLFREDLYFRLNVITIDVPPLRQRGDDILLLARHFVKKYAAELDKSIIRFSDRALNVLCEYHWPGNVRELENVIQRLIVMTESDVIDVADLPSLMRLKSLKSVGIERSLSDVEAEHIFKVLESVDGNKTRAAEILRIDRKTLREKLKKYAV